MSYDPNSIDSMFSRLIAEQSSFQTAVMSRFDGQDLELKTIREQTIKTNGRVTKLEQNERDRNIRLITVASAASVAGSIVAFTAPYLFKLLVK